MTQANPTIPLPLTLPRKDPDPMSAHLGLNTELQLMMSLARSHLRPEDITRLHAWGPHIVDWQAFASRSSWHLIAPLCLYHLTALDSAPWVDEAKHALRPVARALVVQGLEKALVQRRFVEEHLQAHNIPYLAIKGRALGCQFYPDPSLRPARDIDVWVEQRNKRAVIESAQAGGYVTDLSGRCLGDTELLIHIDKRQNGIGLLDPNGARVELDRHLDKAGLRFQFHDCLERAQSVNIDGIRAPVLPIEESFIYACLHHARHGFLRLIWLADLDAIQQSPEFDLGSVMQRADALGLRSTVEACLGFYAACKSDDPLAHAQSDERAQDILKTCMAVSDLQHAKEVSEVKSSLTADFLYEWQLDERDRKHRLMRWVQQQLWHLRPSLADYELIPLPSVLYPAYWILRGPLLVARRAFRRLRYS